MAFSRVPVHLGRALSETGRMLDKVGCRFKGVLPFEQDCVFSRLSRSSLTISSEPSTNPPEIWRNLSNSW